VSWSDVNNNKRIEIYCICYLYRMNSISHYKDNLPTSQKKKKNRMRRSCCRCCCFNNTVGNLLLLIIVTLVVFISSSSSSSSSSNEQRNSVTVPVVSAFTFPARNTRPTRIQQQSRLYIATIPPENQNQNQNQINKKLIPPKDDETLSYAERTRIYRRDTFNYDLWVNHRSTDRFVGNLIDILKSGVLRALIPEVTLMTIVATIICFYNTLFVQGYTDFLDIQHPPFVTFLPLLKLPAEFFTFMTPSLALLLGKKESYIQYQTKCIYIYPIN
jgi:hypothetical protein